MTDVYGESHECVHIQTQVHVQVISRCGQSVNNVFNKIVLPTQLHNNCEAFFNTI